MTLESPIVKDRILLHLFDYREFADKIDVPIEMTQQGVAKAVWIDVRHVVQYVRPLIDEGLVRERTAHVQGGRRRRKVYDLTDAGKLKAFEVRKRLEPGLVRVRDADGTRETRISDLLKETQGRIPLIDVLRQFVHAGSVDISMMEARAPEAYVEMLADAPRVEEFLGRVKELASMLEGEPLPSVFVIRGVAGVGKSTLAARVCELRRGSLHLFWHRIRSWDTPQSILAELGAFLAALGKPGLKTIVSEGQAGLGPQVLRDDMIGIGAILVLDDSHEGSPDVISFLRFMKDVVAEAKDLKLLVVTRRALPFYDRRDVVLEHVVEEIDLGGLEAEVVEGLIPAESAARIPLDLARHPLFLKLLRSAPKRRARAEALRDIRQFISEAIYTELSEPERKMMKIASLYRVPVPPAALFFDANLTHDVLLQLTSRALVTPVEDEGFEVHDTIRDFFVDVLTEAERKELAAFAVPQLNELAGKAKEEGDIPLCIHNLSNALQLSSAGIERLAVCEALGDAQEQIGDLEGTLRSYRLGLEATTHPEYLARLHRKMGFALVARGEIAPAGVAIEDGFQALEGRVSVEGGWLHLARCQLAEWLEEFDDAKDHAIAALGIFRGFDEPIGQCRTHLLLGLIETSLLGGKASVAKRHLEMAIDVAERAEYPQGMVEAHLLLTLLYAFLLGNMEKGVNHLAKAEDLVDSMGGDFKPINLLTVKATVQLHCGADSEGAEAILREAESLARKLHSAGRLAFVKYALAWVDFYQERFGKAREEFLRFAEDIRGRGLAASAVESLCMAAECSLLEGNVDEFKKILVAMEDQALSKGIEARPIMTSVVRAMDLFIKGDVDGAGTILREVLDTQEGGLVIDPALPHIVFAAISQASGRKSESEEHVQASTAVLEGYSRKAQLAILPTRVKLLARTLAEVSGA